jgi:hypothetical protein
VATQACEASCDSSINQAPFFRESARLDRYVVHVPEPHMRAQTAQVTSHRLEHDNTRGRPAYPRWEQSIEPKVAQHNDEIAATNRPKRRRFSVAACPEVGRSDVMSLWKWTALYSAQMLSLGADSADATSSNLITGVCGIRDEFARVQIPLV